MNPRPTLTMREALALVLTLGLAVLLLLPSCGRKSDKGGAGSAPAPGAAAPGGGGYMDSLSMARRRALEVVAMTDAGAIAKGLMLYAAEHKDRYPGGTVEQRFGALLASGVMEPRSLISPMDRQKTPASLADRGAITQIDPAHYSYGLPDLAEADCRAAWNAQIAAGAPVVSDRQVGAGSVWDERAWRGAVGWADGHSTFENQPTVATMIGARTYPADHLFQAPGMKIVYTGGAEP